MMEEFNLCPFCEGKVELKPKDLMAIPAETYYHGRCSECFAVGPASKSKAGAVAAFNHRAQPANELVRIAYKLDNEPLTLKQLQQMDGEPIWITFFGDEENSQQNRWGILGKSVTGTFGIWEDGLVLKEIDYGKTWIAYRRKPEGSENDG